MKNQTSLTFAGQAGFIIETENGYRVAIDLYLSDCCNRYFGFKRLLPYLYNPSDINANLLISTHAHYDHFDPDSVPLMMADEKTELVAAYDVKEEAEKLNLDQSRITYLAEGEIFKNSNISVKAMPCDHGEGTPHAIGLFITVDGKTIYVAGDTCYRADYFENPELSGVDVMIMPINGAFGNLTETEAAKAVNVIKPGLAIPCHYWNFKEHGGNPELFSSEMKDTYNNNNFIMMRPGETISL